MLDLHRRDPDMPGFQELLDTLRLEVFEGPILEGRLDAIQRRVRAVTLVALMDLATDPEASPEVRGLAERMVTPLRTQIMGRGDAMTPMIDRFLGRQWLVETDGPAAAPMPPGQPIGSLSGVAEWSACSW
jgi:hypothetical protein